MHTFLEQPHSHAFDEGNQTGEHGTRLVMWITLAMMAVEIAAGWWFNSMALLADGWHMGSHAIAIGLSAFAYSAARRYAHDHRFAFGTWKIEVLAGFASAILLIGVAFVMVAGSIERLLEPQPIRFLEAMVVAIGGLGVNLACAFILHRAHGHVHAHDHHHDDDLHHHHHHHHDLNLRSAYLHVVADAATSVLAVVALLGGMLYGWGWLDPVMGMAGAFLVARWAYGLVVDTSRVLLDREMDHPVVAEIRAAIEQHDWPAKPRIDDLHVWRVGRRKFAVILSIAAEDDMITPSAIKRLLRQHEELAHVSVEINRSP